MPGTTWWLAHQQLRGTPPPEPAPPEPDTIPLPPAGVVGYVVARLGTGTCLTHASVHQDRETAEAEAEQWRRKGLTSAKFVVCEVREVAA